MRTLEGSRGARHITSCYCKMPTPSWRYRGSLTSQGEALQRLVTSAADPVPRISARGVCKLGHSQGRVRRAHCGAVRAKVASGTCTIARLAVHPISKAKALARAAQEHRGQFPRRVEIRALHRQQEPGKYPAVSASRVHHQSHTSGLTHRVPHLPREASKSSP